MSTKLSFSIKCRIVPPTSTALALSFSSCAHPLVRMFVSAFINSHTHTHTHTHTLSPLPRSFLACDHTTPLSNDRISVVCCRIESHTDICFLPCRWRPSGLTPFLHPSGKWTPPEQHKWCKRIGDPCLFHSHCCSVRCRRDGVGTNQTCHEWYPSPHIHQVTVV